MDIQKKKIKVINEKIEYTTSDGRVFLNEERAITYQKKINELKILEQEFKKIEMSNVCLFENLPIEMTLKRARIKSIEDLRTIVQYLYEKEDEYCDVIVNVEALGLKGDFDEMVENSINEELVVVYTNELIYNSNYKNEYFIDFMKESDLKNWRYEG